MKIAKLLAAGLALLFGAGIASAGTLDDVAKRGELRVAVQTQGPPFSMVDQAGARTGSAHRRVGVRGGVEGHPPNGRETAFSRLAGAEGRRVPPLPHFFTPGFWSSMW